MNAFSLLKPQLTPKLLSQMIHHRFEMDETIHFVSIAPSDFAETIIDGGRLPTFNRELIEDVLLNLDAIGVVELAVQANKDGSRTAHFTWHGVVRDPFEELGKRCNRAFDSGAWPQVVNKRGIQKPALLIEWPPEDFNWENWLLGFFKASAGYYSKPLSKARVKKGVLDRSPIPSDLAPYVDQIPVELSADELVLAGGRGERIRETILKTWC